LRDWKHKDQGCLQPSGDRRDCPPHVRQVRVAALGFAERRPVTAKRIGLRELGFGALTVFAVAAGYMHAW
jgi:hypothetical protein